MVLWLQGPRLVGAGLRQGAESAEEAEVSLGGECSQTRQQAAQVGSSCEWRSSPQLSEF